MAQAPGRCQVASGTREAWPEASCCSWVARQDGPMIQLYGIRDWPREANPAPDKLPSPEMNTALRQSAHRSSILPRMLYSSLGRGLSEEGVPLHRGRQSGAGFKVTSKGV